MSSAPYDELREMVAAAVARHITPHVVAWEESGIPAALFKELGSAELLGIRAPLEDGGQGGDYMSAVVVAEEIARGGSASVGMAVAVHSEMALPPLWQFGTSTQRHRWMGQALTGDCITAIAMTEPNAGSDLMSMETTAKETPEGFVLRGSKLYITNGMNASLFLLAARTSPANEGSRAISLFLVPAVTPGLQRRPMKKLGMHASDTIELTLDGVEVGREALLGAAGEGFMQLMWELRGERLIGAASAMAGALWMLEETITWCRERYVFGSPLASWQVTRHTLADLWSEIVVVRSYVHTLALRWEGGRIGDDEIAAAKLRAGAVVGKVADACLQLHGGAGYMAEMPVARYYVDSRLFRIGGGTDEMMKEIIARRGLRLPDKDRDDAVASRPPLHKENSHS